MSIVDLFTLLLELGQALKVLSDVFCNRCLSITRFLGLDFLLKLAIELCLLVLKILTDTFDLVFNLEELLVERSLIWGSKQLVWHFWNYSFKRDICLAAASSPVASPVFFPLGFEFLGLLEFHGILVDKVLLFLFLIIFFLFFLVVLLW